MQVNNRPNWSRYVILQRVHLCMLSIFLSKSRNGLLFNNQNNLTMEANLLILRVNMIQRTKELFQCSRRSCLQSSQDTPLELMQKLREWCATLSCMANLLSLISSTVITPHLLVNQWMSLKLFCREGRQANSSRKFC